MTAEYMILSGVKDGVETVLGRALMTPEMKMREIARAYFSGDPEDDMSEAYFGVCAMNDLVHFMKKQGWTPPPMEVLP